jgi:hypothetical protein
MYDLISKKKKKDKISPILKQRANFWNICVPEKAI